MDIAQVPTKRYSINHLEGILPGANAAAHTGRCGIIGVGCLSLRYAQEAW